MIESRSVPLRRKLGAGLLFSGMVLWGFGQGASVAQVSEVKGSAYGYYVNNSLFGGPSMLRGFGQAADAPASAASPSVTLPAAGGDESATDADGAAAVYGPATIFGGIWPEDVASSPPSGPITVASEGTTGATGSVTSSARIGLHPTPVAVRCSEDDPGQTNCTAPGGIGPGPLIADMVESRCTATADGNTASVTFVNGTVETKYDAVTQLPTESQPIPTNPAPNTEVSGTIDHVGDSFRVVFNEQIANEDGSLTVNAAHLFLLGPTAVGDAVIASSTCGVNATAAPGATTTTQPGATTTTTGTGTGGSGTGGTGTGGTGTGGTGTGGTGTGGTGTGGTGTGGTGTGASGGGTAGPADPTTGQPRFTG